MNRICWPLAGAKAKSPQVATTGSAMATERKKVEQKPYKPDMAGERIYNYIFIGLAVVVLLYVYSLTSDVNAMHKRTYGQQRIEASELPKK